MLSFVPKGMNYETDWPLNKKSVVSFITIKLNCLTCIKQDKWMVGYRVYKWYANYKLTGKQ